MNNPKPHLLIATKNRGKLAEFERLLGGQFTVEGLDGQQIDLPEEGTESYRANAEAKAIAVARATGRLTLGDDSGIEVTALGGEPGIVSARYAGEPVSDARNIEKLLDALAASASPDRSARFVCWLAMAGPSGLLTSVEGTCEGTIGIEPHGANGFGYDPIFRFLDGRTMAQLSDWEKDDVSHRGNALRAILPALAEATGNA
ncbi:MAG: RdgB/HAM1 family non-canonical purine NTP pyrophosphatase [Thermomicrobiales bacterium]|nr:RdgB/HAM1 family non-canonical purine NTP pyrophosphatase [Thermomicrobiales bacterium]